MILKHEKTIQKIVLVAMGFIVLAFVIAAIVNPEQFNPLN